MLWKKFRPTVGDRIVDTLTFSTSYYFGFISSPVVEVTSSPNLPPSPSPKKVLYRDSITYCTVEATLNGDWGLVNDLECGRH